jgi:hypothetical protein
MKLPCYPSHSSSPAIAALLRIASAAALFQTASADPSTSYNTGSLGIAGDGASTTGVLIDQPGVIRNGLDFSSTYAAGEHTLVTYQAALNPPLASSPFTIEFWARPTATDGDDAPIGNRLSTGDRSGWVFFQRNESTGWNFRMYNGAGSTVGWDITGGTATLNAWSHVVVAWDGTTPRLYVNGAFASATNNPAFNGVYKPNGAGINFHVGALIGGASPSTGSIDEIAFYASALSATQIENHYKTATGVLPGSYSAMVLADGAIEYLQQNPPEAKLTWVAGNPTLTFTGILAQSTNLTSWDDLAVTSPYTVPSPSPDKIFFRSHR